MNKEKKVSNDKLASLKKNPDSGKSSAFGKDDKENVYEEEKIDDNYNIEQIYQRDLMSSQHRRFGSPDYVIRNNSMMFQLPTNNLEAVKPGVELIGGDKPLKGPKYNENPYFECEEEVSGEFDNSISESEIHKNQNIEEDNINTKKVYENPEMHQYLKYNNDIEDKYSISSKGDLESKSSNIDHPKELKDKILDKPFVPKIQNLDNGQKLILAPITIDENQNTNNPNEPFTAKTTINKRLNTPKFNEDNFKNKKSRNINEDKSKLNKRSSTVDVNKIVSNSEIKVKGGLSTGISNKNAQQLGGKNLAPVRLPTNFDPKIEKILNAMEKKTNPKTKTVKRFKMSKEDYYNLVQELNKNRNYPFGKPASHKSDKRENILSRNLSEANIKRESFNKTPQTVISKINRSKIVMKNTALNLLIEKSKLSEYMRFATIDVNIGSNDVLNSQNTQDPSRMTFMNASQLSPLSNDFSKPNFSINAQNDDYFQGKDNVGVDSIQDNENPATSRLPKINRSLYEILPKIQSRERKPSEVSVYLQNSFKTTSIS